MKKAKKTKYDRRDGDGIPTHLQKLVKKCPQWRTSIINLCGGECYAVYQRMTYKEMEKEISICLPLGKASPNRAGDLAEALKQRLQFVMDGKSYPKVEQQRYYEASVGKRKLLNTRINSFLYGGKVYMEHLKGSKQFDGLLDIKIKSSKRGDVVFHRELQIACDEVNALMTFLSSDHDKILKFINCRGDVTRQFNLDRQAKGTEGLKVRKLASQKKMKKLKSMGKAPRVFVPMANVLIGVECTVVSKQKVNIATCQY